MSALASPEAFKGAAPAAPVYNFSPGPAMLPRAVMAKARDEFLNWRGKGVSVLEISHRSRDFEELAAQSRHDLSRLLDVPDNYKILFLQGGATNMMSMAPLNLCKKGDGADYLVTGHWSARAAQEAAALAKVNIIADAGDFTAIPAAADWRLGKKPAYLYFCDNETIAGVEFDAPPSLPKTHRNTALVCDMTSSFLSRPVDVGRYGIIFAGAQKNFAPAGLTVALVREDLLRPPRRRRVPSLYNFSVLARHDSMFNTPPTFNWYMAALTFAWTREQGGVERMHENALARSRRLYGFIDGHDFYHNPVKPRHRSRMNVPFFLADGRLDETFLKEAESNGLVGLKGHRKLGGMRASMYNGMPAEGAAALADFMADFARRHG